MAEERVQRRLAAILAVDVVGYSRLMGTDEAGTRARYNDQLDEIVQPNIDIHRGRTLSTLGFRGRAPSFGGPKRGVSTQPTPNRRRRRKSGGVFGYSPLAAPSLALALLPHRRTYNPSRAEAKASRH